MSKDKIKQTAARYADALVQSSDLACEMYDKDKDNFSENESYIVVELTSLYYLYKIGKISAEETKKRQSEILRGMKNHE